MASQDSFNVESGQERSVRGQTAVCYTRHVDITYWLYRQATVRANFGVLENGKTCAWQYTKREG